MPKYTTGETLGPFRNDTVVPGLLGQPPPVTLGAPPSMGCVKHRRPAEWRQGLTEFHYSSQRVFMSQIFIFKMEDYLSSVIFVLIMKKKLIFHLVANKALREAY